MSKQVEHIDNEDSRALAGRMDEENTIFFARELEHIKARAYDVKREDLHARMIFPVSREVPAGSRVITYRQYDMIGSAVILAAHATDIPLADVVGKEFSSKVYEIASGYMYTMRDIREGQLAGRPLDVRRAMAARRAISEKENSLMFQGDAKTGIVGFFRNPNIPRYAFPNGAGGSPLWANKTADEILADLNALIDVPSNLTNGIESPRRVVMSVALHNLISKKRFTDGSGMTVLSAFLQNANGVEVMPLQECKDAADDGGDLVFAYTANPELLSMEIPMDITQHPVREKGALAWEVAMTEELGGVLVYYPLSIVFGNGAG